MISRKIPHYNFKNLDFKKIKNGDFLKSDFYIALPMLQSEYDTEKTLFLVSDCFELKVIKRSYKDIGEDMPSIRREGCFYFNEENEWILEARFKMTFFDKSKTATYTLHLPLSASFIKDAEIGIYFDGTWLRFMLNGEIINENSGLDRFDYNGGEIFIDNSFKEIKVATVKETELTYRQEKQNISSAFFFPHGWNTFIGDVMNFTHNGVYHLMYLIDRRHHGSRNGCGAHYICHLTSENLVDWFEQEPIAEITKPWITYGTGTMFFHNGKYYMTYGFHTERCDNTLPKITPHFNEETQTFTNITFDEVFEKEGLPTGASYSYSEDGINFKPSNILIHSARNPSAYTNKNGGITLYCGYGGDGVFESDSIEKPFKRSQNNFDFVKNSLMRNTSECPAFFDWNGYKYLIVGFTGYFRTFEKNSDVFLDAAALGENIYDGLSVPMVAEFGDNRRIIAGWVESPWGWGGVLMQRELIAEENGKLGMKWIPEIMPKAKGLNLLNSENDILNGFELEQYKSYYLELEIDPKKANRFGISLSNENSACTFELDFNSKRMQINDAITDNFGEKLPTMLELMKSGTKEITNTPRSAKNYALPDINGINERFTLKMILRYSRRMRSTVIDAEIAGRRTLISVRSGFYPSKIKAIFDGEVSLLNSALNFILDEE